MWSLRREEEKRQHFAQEMEVTIINLAEYHLENLVFSDFPVKQNSQKFV